MDAVVVARAGDPRLSPELLDGMFRLRDAVFRRRLRWDVRSAHGRERDEYDDLDPVYVISHRDRRVTGCARLLPTRGPYMLRDVFVPLLRGETAPARGEVWELSRFATAPCSDRDLRQANHGHATFLLMQHAFEFARRHGIRQYVAATKVSFERLLRRIGVPMTRFGDGESQRFGRALSVAVRIELDERCRRAVGGELLGGEAPREAA